MAISPIRLFGGEHFNYKKSGFFSSSSNKMAQNFSLIVSIGMVNYIKIDSILHVKLSVMIFVSQKNNHSQSHESYIYIYAMHSFMRPYLCSIAGCAIAYIFM